MIHFCGHIARRALVIGTLAALGACSWWPWSSTRTRIPDPPVIAAPIPVHQLWSLSTAPGGVNFQPVHAGDSVWAAAGDGTVVRVDPATGAVRWRVRLERRLIAGVGSDGDTAVVAGRDGTVIALDGSGAIRWSAPAGAEIVTVPSVGLGLVVIRTSDNRVSAFDLDSGKRRWSFDRQSPPLVLRQTTGIAMDTGSAYVGLPGGRLVALMLDSGALRWEAAVSMPRGANEIERIADVVGMPLLAARQACAVTFQGRIGCFEAASGRTLWAQDLSSPSGFDMDADLIVVPDDAGTVHALSLQGTTVWTQDALQRRSLAAPLLTQKYAIVGDQSGLVHVLGRADGRVVARMRTDGSRIVSAPVAAAGAILVQTSAGGLYAFRVE